MPTPRNGLKGRGLQPGKAEANNSLGGDWVQANSRRLEQLQRRGR